jgi:hypothetical protein
MSFIKQENVSAKDQISETIAFTGSEVPDLDLYDIIPFTKLANNFNQGNTTLLGSDFFSGGILLIPKFPTDSLRLYATIPPIINTPRWIRVPVRPVNCYKTNSNKMSITFPTLTLILTFGNIPTTSLAHLLIYQYITRRKS